MARLFNDATPDYFQKGIASGVYPGNPATIMCWFNPNDNTLEQHLLCFGGNWCGK